jgi:hypothetical protein
MITFGEVQVTGAITKTNRALCNVKMTFNSVLYNWQVYVPMANMGNIMAYLTLMMPVYEADITAKEAAWTALSPKTEVIDGVTYNIPKERIVHATVPDYEESVCSPELDILAIKRLLVSLTSTILASPTITQQQLDDLATISDDYTVGKAYAVDETFSYLGKLYRVIQAHTSQATWIPSTTPALYTVKTPAGTIAEWVQPLGSSDAYPIGAKVLHNGFTWQNSTASNVWEPGVYGWTKL